MTGTILALVCIIVSVVWAVIEPANLRAPMLWALWAIFVAIFLEGHFVLP